MACGFFFSEIILAFCLNIFLIIWSLMFFCDYRGINPRCISLEWFSRLLIFFILIETFSVVFVAVGRLVLKFIIQSWWFFLFFLSSSFGINNTPILIVNNWYTQRIKTVHHVNFSLCSNWILSREKRSFKFWLCS